MDDIKDEKNLEAEPKEIEDVNFQDCKHSY